MSAYQLEATDGSGSHSVPAGETVVGRGPLLGIADKRVSRSHAVLEVVDDQLRIKGMHVNPCFYQASGKSMFAPLERNEWCWLHSGDCISLLPDKYSFRIIANNSSEEATLRNSQELDEETGLNDNSNSPITSETKAASSPQHGPSSLTVTSNTRNNGKIRNNVPSSAVVESPKPAQRKRVLPNWMLQGDLPVQALPSHVITAGKKKRTVTQRTQTTSSLKSKDKDIPEEKQSEVSFPSTSSSLTRTATPVNLQKGLVVDNEEDDMKEEHCDDTPKLSTPPPSNSSPSGSPSTSNNKSSVAKADNNDNISLSPVSPQQNTQQAPKKRFPCMYGDQCYRKNPTHFQEFSHPGDSDYYDAENGSQDDNDDRPECPYGTDCYRKNPQHKLEYKHTRPPGRKLRKRNPKKAKRSVLDGDSDDDGETNDYDLEDSFIDEDEDFDITDEDSDWMTDSEDKDSEDVKELLKEAKKFVRGKR